MAIESFSEQSSSSSRCSSSKDAAGQRKRRVITDFLQEDSVKSFTVKDTIMLVATLSTPGLVFGQAFGHQCHDGHSFENVPRPVLNRWEV